MRVGQRQAVTLSDRTARPSAPGTADVSKRIFTASQVGDLKRVRNLQKLMLRSRSKTLLAGRRVTEINAGRLTAGVDGRIVLGADAKAALAEGIHRRRPWQARPVKRVYIPKADGRRRPLGIPVIVDRALQARVTAALQPEREARFEPRSYGFRPGRSCQDTVQAIFATVKGRNPARRWVLDADLKAAFDRIDHHHLLGRLGRFPAREQIQSRLTAGVIDQGLFTSTEEGTPQGGLCSAEHNPPYEQCWVMRSVGLFGLVRVVAGVEHCA